MVKPLLANELSFQNITNSIRNGISFLKQRQFYNGEFCCYFSNNEQMQVSGGSTTGWCVPDSSVFPTILIGSSLESLSAEPGVKTILGKIIDFVVTQRKTGSVWNHFTKEHTMYAVCPFDVDDTACASALLSAHGVTFPSNQQLLLSNTNKDSLFYTFFCLRRNLNFNFSNLRLAAEELKHPIKSYMFWQITEAGRNDIDAIVNANILYYFGECEATKPIVALLIDIIANEKESDCDRWYRNVFVVYYFITRNYFNQVLSLAPVKGPIVKRILASTMASGLIGNSVLDTALSVCSLLNLKHTGPELTNAVKFIMESQRETGDWERRIFYDGGPKKLSGWGSEELTTAICLEAIGRFRLDQSVNFNEN